MDEVKCTDSELGGLSADTDALPLTAWKVTRRPHADRVEQGNEDCLNSAYFWGGGGLGACVIVYGPYWGCEGGLADLRILQLAKHKEIQGPWITSPNAVQRA
jgi:hypothetical protein